MKRNVIFGIMAMLIAFAGACYNPYLALREPPDFSIRITKAGSIQGDRVTCTPAEGKAGDIITINYTLAITRSNNSLAFSGTGIPIKGIKDYEKDDKSPATVSGTGLYIINKADAGKDNVINIKALFYHSPPDITVMIEMRGNVAGDNVSCAPEVGKPGESVTIDYTLAVTEPHNSVTFSGLSVPITGIDNYIKGVTGTEELVARTATYVIREADADNDDVVTIKASFFHGALLPETIAFDNNNRDETRLFGLGSYTNAVTVRTGNPANTKPITYESSDDSIAWVDGNGKVTFIKVGIVTITAAKAAGEGYGGAAASYKLTIGVQHENMKFKDDVVTIVFGDAPPDNPLIETGEPGNENPITYESSDKTTATVNEFTGAVTVVKAGTTVIKAAKAPDGNHAGAAAEYELIIEKQEDEIAFEAPLTETGDEDDVFTKPLSKTGNGTGAITYSSSNPNVATAAAGANAVIVSTGKEGITTITATKAADANYREAKAEFTLKVEPAVKDLEMSEDPEVIKDKLYDGTNIAEIISIGRLAGIRGSHNVAVSAEATYETDEAGTWTITVVYEISGADRHLYNKPQDWATTGTIFPNDDPGMYRKTVWDFNKETARVIIADSEKGRGREETFYGATRNSRFPLLEIISADSNDKQPLNGKSLMITTQNDPATSPRPGEAYNQAPVFPVTLPYPLKEYGSIFVDIKVLDASTLAAGDQGQANNLMKSVYAYAAGDFSPSPDLGHDTPFVEWGFGNPMNDGSHFAELAIGRGGPIPDLLAVKDQWVTIEIPIANYTENWGTVRNVQVPGSGVPADAGIVYIALGLNVGKETKYLMDNVTFVLKDDFISASARPAAFDKNQGRKENTNIIVTLTDSTTMGLTVTNGGKTLTRDTDYTVNSDGHVVTLKKPYLQTLAVGTETFTFSIGGKNVNFAIDIKDTGDNFTVNFNQAAFSKVKPQYGQDGTIAVIAKNQDWYTAEGTDGNGGQLLVFKVDLPAGTVLKDYNYVSFEYSVTVNTTNGWASTVWLMADSASPPFAAEQNNDYPGGFLAGMWTQGNQGNTQVAPGPDGETLRFPISAATPGAGSNTVYFAIRQNFYLATTYTIRNFTLE